jgi:hypothetical protein
MHNTLVNRNIPTVKKLQPVYSDTSYNTLANRNNATANTRQPTDRNPPHNTLANKEVKTKKPQPLYSNFLQNASSSRNVPSKTPQQTSNGSLYDNDPITKTTEQINPSSSFRTSWDRALCTSSPKSFLTHAFPKWGGHIGQLVFRNTCSIDNWLVIFHYLCLENKAIKERIHGDDSLFLAELEQLYSTGQFNKIKYRLMEINNIPNFRGMVDFFGNEWNHYVNHLSFFYKNTQLSKCSSRCCPLQERLIQNSSGVTWANFDASLSEEVASWFEADKDVSYCGQKFTSRPPKEAPVRCFESNR